MGNGNEQCMSKIFFCIQVTFSGKRRSQEPCIYSVSMSDHNSWTPEPIGLKSWLGNSGEPRECA